MPKNEKHENIKRSTFREGMTLNEYLNTMEISQNYDEDEEKIEEDLYETCMQNGENKLNSVTTFEIQEIEEGEEEAEYEEPLKCKILSENHSKLFLEEQTTKSKFSKQETECTEKTVDCRESTRYRTKFLVKCLSKSPYSHKNNKIDIVKHSSFSQTVRLNGNEKIPKGGKALSAGPTSHGKLMKPLKEGEIESHKLRKIKLGEILAKTGLKIQYSARNPSISLERKINESLSKNLVNLPSIRGIRSRGMTDVVYDKKNIDKKYIW